ncbi:Tn3 family transposase [Nonomuraea sp. NPDC049400]|uniref:Tn3 family transposase n=1 Tax=Nonomuraea sp. NPDC049400 TaxID=3364352 RepID=UPI0037BCA853
MNSAPLAALGMAVNAAAPWNSRHLSAAVDKLRGQGAPAKDSDAARLFPLGRPHLNVLGFYVLHLLLHSPAQGMRQFGEMPDLPNGGMDEEGV